MVVKCRTLENLAMKPSFWSGRRVFITGHTGFKGSWISLWLQFLGAKVTGYALPPKTNPNLFSIAYVEQNMDSIFGDVRDYDSLYSALRQSQAEIVIHMAAQPLVRYSYFNPIETYSTNVMGTVNIFESVRHGPHVQAVLNVTSDKCYENREWVWGGTGKMNLLEDMTHIAVVKVVLNLLLKLTTVRISMKIYFYHWQVQELEM